MSEVGIAIKNNPVRLYSILTAVIALAAHYYQDLPTALLLGLLAAIFGTGEVVRAKVWPQEHVDDTVADAEAMAYLSNMAAFAPDKVEPNTELGQE